MESGLARFQVMVFLLAAAMLTGCGSVSDSQVRASSGMAGAFGGTTCPNGTAAVGEVYEASGNTQKMTEQAQGLVSATLIPSSLGTVPARGGIELELRIPSNVLGSGVLPSPPSGSSSTGSRISLQIKDSWTGTIDKTTQKP
ncbi:MAG TPA: hypothetical protein PL182_04755, partial [Pseudobdellovibrionaceae bacterium]|nr:hypothetical protein [Pseudobdellovibrionaceae bacterium]